MLFNPLSDVDININRCPGEFQTSTNTVGVYKVSEMLQIWLVK